MPHPAKFINPAYVFFCSQLDKHPCRARPDVPDIAGARTMPILQWRDGDWKPAPIHGWYAQTLNAKGTILIAHGYMANCMQEIVLDLAREGISQGWNVVCPDLRMHGRSHNACPTFGLAESWDLESVLSWITGESGLQGPVIVAGYSLGALAGSNLLARDRRLRGGFFISPPGWPWDAIGVEAKIAAPMAIMINMWYGRDVLGEGDIRRLSEASHNPLVAYAMGVEDHYNIGHTLEVFKSKVWKGAKVETAQKCKDHDFSWNGTENIFIRCEASDHLGFKFNDFPAVVQSYRKLLLATART